MNTLSSHVIKRKSLSDTYNNPLCSLCSTDCSEGKLPPCSALSRRLSTHSEHVPGSTHFFRYVAGNGVHEPRIASLHIVFMSFGACELDNVACCSVCYLTLLISLCLSVSSALSSEQRSELMLSSPALPLATLCAKLLNHKQWTVATNYCGVGHKLQPDDSPTITQKSSPLYLN